MSGGRLGKPHILGLWWPHWHHSIVISRGNEQRWVLSRLPKMPAVSAEQPLFSLDGVRPGLVAEVSHNRWLPAVSALHSNHITWAQW